ncbi:hypothetical protein, partial [Psychrobacter immobilis]|uniref:hypothetical protein n=1 Tax=Psychrobacter immobilis TaxID=498 RepID=UPI003FD23353
MNQNIKDAILKGDLVIFLGAGASANAKNSSQDSLPLGSGLGSILAEDLGMTFNPNEDNLQSVYEAYLNLKGTETLNK